MPESEELESDVVESKKHRVTVTISSLGNERRTLVFNDMEEERARSIVQSIDAAFGVIRTSNSLMLVDSSGVATFANLDNIAFVEVNIV